MFISMGEKDKKVSFLHFKFVCKLFKVKNKKNRENPNREKNTTKERIKKKTKVEWHPESPDFHQG